MRLTEQIESVGKHGGDAVHVRFANIRDCCLPSGYLVTILSASIRNTRNYVLHCPSFSLGLNMNYQAVFESKSTPCRDVNLVRPAVTAVTVWRVRTSRSSPSREPQEARLLYPKRGLMVR